MPCYLSIPTPLEDLNLILNIKLFIPPILIIQKCFCSLIHFHFLTHFLSLSLLPPTSESTHPPTDAPPTYSPIHPLSPPSTTTTTTTTPSPSPTHTTTSFPFRTPTHTHTPPPPTPQGDLYVPLEFDTEWDSTDHVPEPGGSDSEGSEAGGTFFKNQKDDGRKTGNSLKKKFHIGEDLKTLLGTYSALTSMCVRVCARVCTSELLSAHYVSVYECTVSRPLPPHHHPPTRTNVRTLHLTTFPHPFTACIGGVAVDVLHKLLDPAEGDAAVARALYSADLLEQKTKILPYPPIKDPAVTRERKAKYADGMCLYMSTVL